MVDLYFKYPPFAVDWFASFNHCGFPLSSSKLGMSEVVCPPVGPRNSFGRMEKTHVSEMINQWLAKKKSTNQTPAQGLPRETRHTCAIYWAHLKRESSLRSWAQWLVANNVEDGEESWNGLHCHAQMWFSCLRKTKFSCQSFETILTNYEISCKVMYGNIPSKKLLMWQSTCIWETNHSLVGS